MADKKFSVIGIAALIASIAALGVSLFVLCSKPWQVSLSEP